ncbi:hypothetical protein Tco_0515608, partial [Tanacetum coccineum]
MDVRGGGGLLTNEEAHRGAPITNTTSGKRNPLCLLGSV